MILYKNAFIWGHMDKNDTKNTTILRRKRTLDFSYLDYNYLHNSQLCLLRFFCSIF